MLRFCFCFLFFLFCICLLLGFWDYDWDWEWSGDWHGSGFKPTYHLLLGCIKDNRWRDCLIFYLIFYYSNYSFNCVSISKGSIKLRLRMYSLCFTIPNYYQWNLIIKSSFFSIFIFTFIWNQRLYCLSIIFSKVCHAYCKTQRWPLCPISAVDSFFKVKKIFHLIDSQSKYMI